MLLERLNLHGCTVAEAMARFVEAYNRLLARASGGERRGLEVIHGKGKEEAGSAIREELRIYLRKQGPRIKGYNAQLAMRGAEYLFDVSGKLVYIHGEDASGNSGSTIVFPKQRISLPREWVNY